MKRTVADLFWNMSKMVQKVRTIMQMEVWTVTVSLNMMIKEEKRKKRIITRMEVWTILLSTNMTRQGIG